MANTNRSRALSSGTLMASITAWRSLGVPCSVLAVCLIIVAISTAAPPAASILRLASLEKRCADTVSARSISPRPSTFTRISRPLTSLASRKACGVTSASPSKRAASSSTLTVAYSTREYVRKAALGGQPLHERQLAAFEAGPYAAAGAGLLTLHPHGPSTCPCWRCPGRSAYVGGGRPWARSAHPVSFFLPTDLHQVPDLVHHAHHHRAVLSLDLLVETPETQGANHPALLLRVADGALLSTLCESCSLLGSS